MIRRVLASEWKIAWLIGLAILLALAVATWQLDRPGLYYDELLFVNAALGGKTNNFISARILGIPVLLMDYIGALKAWIYAPIFALFPVDAWSVRLPAIIIGLAGTLLAALAMREWFGKRAAFFALVLTLFDPTILTHSRLDWGPNALMIFLRGALLLSLAKWTRAPNAARAWWIFACLLAGLFEKLSFLWLAGGALAAVVILYGSQLWLAMRRDRSQSIAWILSFGITFLAGSRGAWLSHQLTDESTITWTARLAQAWHLFQLTWAGGGALGVVMGDGRRFAIWFALPVVGCLAVALLGSRAFFSGRADHRRPWKLIVVLTLITALLFILTKSATGPHHSAVLSGLWQLPFAPLLACLVDFRRTRLIALAAVTLAALGMGLVSAFTIHTLATQTPHPNWDQANWRLGQHVATHPGDRFIITDWGMGNQVLAATRDATNFSDQWPAFTDPYSAEAVVRAEAAKGPCHYVLRPAELSTFKNTESNLRIALNSIGARIEVVLILQNAENQPVIVVWCAYPRPAANHN